MPQLNPIPWVFLFALAWGVLIFWGLHKFTNVINPIMEMDNESVSGDQKEYLWPW
uniref:ATP synthase complex subunit 8 n=1 Tax=Branchiostoma belcheri TaxID=7741 RepID=C6L2L2_BRABE|nr:ATP synthase F0 subunit 8 [Branchiostoma belcheri]